MIKRINRDKEIKSSLNNRLCKMVSSIRMEESELGHNSMKLRNCNEIISQNQFLEKKFERLDVIKNIKEPRIGEIIQLNNEIIKELNTAEEEMNKCLSLEYCDFSSTKSYNFLFKNIQKSKENESDFTMISQEISVNIIIKKINDTDNDIYIKIKSEKTESFLVLVWGHDIKEGSIEKLEPINNVNKNQSIKIGELKSHNDRIAEFSLKICVYEESKELRDYLSLFIAKEKSNIGDDLKKISKRLNLEISEKTQMMQ